MSSQLLSLPRELRDQIYINVLSSPTGFVFLPDAQDESDWYPRVPVPNPHLKIEPYGSFENSALYPSEPIFLSFTRVCKQIHHETRGLFWAHNALYIQRVDDLACFMKLPSLVIQLRSKLTHVRMDFDPLTRGRNIEITAEALRTFVTWSNSGVLVKLDLRIDSTATRWSTLFGRGSRASVQESLELFKGTIVGGDGGEERLAAKVEKRLILSTPTPRWPDDEMTADDLLRDVEFLLHPSSLLMKLHKCFGGELWIGAKRYG